MPCDDWPRQAGLQPSQPDLCPGRQLVLLVLSAGSTINAVSQQIWHLSALQAIKQTGMRRAKLVALGLSGVNKRPPKSTK
jgi:hypothetical protein